MSASREKKNRQDLTAQEGFVDAKAEKLAKEAAEQRKSKILYTTIAVVFVVVGVLLAIMKSGVVEKNSTAVTIDGEKFSPAYVTYFYNETLQNVKNSDYYSYMGLDENASLDSQVMGDLAKMIMGVTEEGEITWDDYLKEYAVKGLQQIYCVSKAAEAEGITFDETMQSSIDSTMETLGSYASMSGYSSEEYLKLIYGKYMTTDIFKDIMRMYQLASGYQTQYSDSLNYSDQDLEEYFQSDAECFTFADYETIYFNGTAASTTDSNGNAVEPTEEESAAAAKAAEDAAADAEKRYADGETLEEIAEAYSDIATYNSTEQGSNDGTDLGTWVFDEARKDGDTTTIESNGSYTFVLFHSAGRPEYKTVNVRHILFQADTSELDTTSATYDADSKAIWEEAKAKAEDALAQWKAGAATADSFAELANELSDDPGSNTNGGLYNDVSKNSGYVESFENWCMDSGRKVGDTGIVETSYGYHVMYLDGFGDAYWKTLVRDEMTNAAMNEWLNGILDSAEIVEGSGMKNVG